MYFMTALYRLQLWMKSPVEDGIGPIPHSLALSYAVNRQVVCLTYSFLHSPKLGIEWDLYCRCKQTQIRLLSVERHLRLDLLFFDR